MFYYSVVLQFVISLSQFAITESRLPSVFFIGRCSENMQQIYRKTAMPMKCMISWKKVEKAIWGVL